MPKLILIIISVLALVAGLFVSQYYFKPAPGNTQSGIYKDPPGGDFTLNSNKGKVHLGDFKGKVVLLYFGYTSCPDVCPTSLLNIASAFKKLNQNELAQVQALFISVDPGRDTVEKLASYTHYFHPKILGITGTKQQIDDIAARYDVKYKISKEQSAAGYLVDHTAYLFVLDKSGKIQTFLPHDINPEGINLVIHNLLKLK